MSAKSTLKSMNSATQAVPIDRSISTTGSCWQLLPTPRSWTIFQTASISRWYPPTVRR